jgi:hypothetical protein
VDFRTGVRRGLRCNRLLARQSSQGVFDTTPIDYEEEQNVELPGSSYLLNLAVISITFVGFSTIAFIFRQAQGAGLSRNEMVFISTFIQGGLLITVFSLVPSLLGLFEITPSLIWRLSSLALLLSHLFFIVSYWRHRSRDLSGTERAHLVISSVLETVINLSLLINAIGIGIEPNVGLYALGATAVLGQLMLLFLFVLPQFLQPLQMD